MTTGQQKTIGTALRALPFFSGIQDKYTSPLQRAAVKKSYARRQHVFHQNDPADRVFFVINGWLKLYTLTTDGDEVVVGMCGPGDILGESAVFDRNHYPYSCEAASETALVEIPAPVFVEQARCNYDLARRLIANMAQGLHSLRAESGQMACMNAVQRLGCLLLRLSSHMHGGGGTFTLPYDKTTIAMQLGMDPTTFSRTIRRLEELGVSMTGSEIRIRSFSDLAALCCPKCPHPICSCAARGHCAPDKPAQSLQTE